MTRRQQRQSAAQRNRRPNRLRSFQSKLTWIISQTFFLNEGIINFFMYLLFCITFKNLPKQG